MALAVGILINAWPGRGPQNERPKDKGVAGGPADPVEPGPPGPIVTGSRDAANVDELMSHLRQGVRHIRLTGPEYDLVKYRGADGYPVDALLAGDDVQLEGVGGPIVRLGFAPDGKARSKTLTLRGPGGGRGSAAVQGIRFILPAVDDDDEDAGLIIAAFDRVTIEDCTFATEYRTVRDGPAALGLVLRGGSAALSRCYFARGCVGVTVDGPGRVTATECAIGPQHAGVRVIRTATDVSGETEVTFTHCSALVPANGAVVEVDDQVPCVVRAGHCLFAGPDRIVPDEIPVVLRQRQERAAATALRGRSRRPAERLLQDRRVLRVRRDLQV